MPPKTASTSLKLTLEKQGIVFDTHKENLPQIHLKLSEIKEKFQISDLTDYKTIQIVRNPYTRFVSSFFFIKKIMPSDYTPIFKKLEVSDFIDHLIESKKSNDFIKSFYGDVGYVESRIVSGSSWGGSRLFDSQSSWNDINLEVNVFKLEDLNQDITPLNGILKTSIKNLFKVNSQGITKNYMDFLNQNDMEKIYELYSEDFIKYGYKN
jgi:hypothetical protein